MAGKKLVFKIKPKEKEKPKKGKALVFKIKGQPKTKAKVKVTKKITGQPKKVTKPVTATYAITGQPSVKKVTKKVPKVVKTKGGEYPVYKKKTKAATGFRAAFAVARKAGKKIFTWQGRKYTTKVK